MQNTEKKKMIIFLAAAYGITYLMAIPMYFGMKKGCDLSVFPIAQMLYPASGVILGKLLTSKEKELPLPKAAYIITLILTLLSIIVSLVSVFFPLRQLDLGIMKIDPYNLGMQYLIIPVSLAVFILFIVSSREKKDNAGILRNNMKKSILIILLFVVIYTARVFLSFGISELINHDGAEQMKEWFKQMATPLTLAGIANVIINYVFTFILFFGEEYGWRYYLQPRMQQKFGLRAGVILLGIVWGLWHMPIDFMYYTQTTGLQMQVNQIITCISYSIFFGWAYMKTQNIWVPVAIHYLNNNLIPVIEANYSPDVLQNNDIAWSDIPVAAVLMIFYILFIFSREYSSKSGNRE